MGFERWLSRRGGQGFKAAPCDITDHGSRIAGENHEAGAKPE